MLEKSTEREEGMEFISLKRNERKHNARIEGMGVESEKLKDNKKGEGTSRGSQILLELLSREGHPFETGRNGEMRMTDSKIFF